MEAGLSESKAAETAKNDGLSKEFVSVLSSIGDVTKTKGNFAYDIAAKTQSTNWLRGHLDFLLPYVKYRQVARSIH